jgi:hypothetical protein
VTDPDDHPPQSGRSARPEKVIEKIHRIENRAGYRANDDRPRGLDWDDPQDRERVRQRFRENGDVDEAILPGFGPRGRAGDARDDCGDPHPFVCEECGNSVEFGRTCAQSVCSRCAVAWVRDAAIQKSAKARRVRKEKHQITSNLHQKTHHQVISPRLDWFYTLARDGYTLEEAKEKTREVVKFILDEMRAQGILVGHSYRGENDDGSLKSEEDDMGSWKERLNSGREWHDDVREELAWNPHYHAIVVSDFLRGDGFTDEIEDKTGWVIHRITGDEGKSLPNDGAMSRALTYSISHANLRVNPESYNQSEVWEVGSIGGDQIKSTPRFSPRPHDLDWADGVVRRHSATILGLQSGTSDCGAELPDVDDPDELARKVLDRMFPNRKRRDQDVSTDTVLYHINEGNIRVDVETSEGGGGEITVEESFGGDVSRSGWDSAADLPSAPNTAIAGDGGLELVEPIDDLEDVQEESDEDVDDDRDGADECSGTLIPLEEARQRGLLDDPEWRQDAPHADQALETDQEWPADLDRFPNEPPGDSIGVAGGG